MNFSWNLYLLNPWQFCVNALFCWKLAKNMWYCAAKFRILWLNYIQYLVKSEDYYLQSAERNYHEYLEIVQHYKKVSKFFRSRRVLFHNSKNFWKTENFSGQDCLTLVILFKFCMRIPPSHPEIQVLVCAHLRKLCSD